MQIHFCLVEWSGIGKKISNAGQSDQDNFTPLLAAFFRVDQKGNHINASQSLKKRGIAIILILKHWIPTHQEETRGDLMKAEPGMPRLSDLHLFDSCVTLGRFSGEACISTAAELIALMDRYAIAEALVHEYHARGLYPLEHGNQRLLELIRGQPRLHPVWVLEPPAQPGIQAAVQLVAGTLAAGVRAVRLRLPAKGALPWLWDDLCAALKAHRVPCFLDFGPPGSTLGTLTDQDVEAVRDIALGHPHLPLILSRVMGGLGVHPAVGYLIRRVPNLYLDITGILEYWRRVAYEVGPERVLFASGMPFTDPGILVSNVQYDRKLDETAKHMICGDNLRRLLEGVK
jgi:predicted TIM-barrel fold metal-dependent hydrolase